MPTTEMARLECLLLVLAICEGVFAREEHGFVEPLDFSQFFDSGSSGVSSLASGRIAAAMLNVDKSQYPQLFDTIVSSSIDSLQTQVAPKDNPFSPERYGFNPIASSGFYPPRKAARIVAQPHKSSHHLNHQAKQHPTHLPLRQQQQSSPLLYDIQQVHDADYKVYQPEEDEQGEILAALRKDPSVSAYFKPAQTNVEVSHPLKYRKEKYVEHLGDEQNYTPDAYITGSSRIRRYAGNKKSEKLRSSGEDEEDDPYDYKADYVSRPKAFDSELYSSAYKDEKEEDGDHGHEEKDPNKDYEYPYDGYDSGYDHKEYERIKELSEKQAAEIKQNPGNCKEVLKDGMTCMTCKDPKTGGNYESCSYVTEPKNNKYAYSKEKKFDSKDEPDEPEGEQKSDQREETKEDSGEYPASSPKHEEKTHDDYKKEDEEDEPTTPKYNAYYVHSSKPLHNKAALVEASDAESSEEKEDTLTKPYNYKQALPGFYSDNEPKKDVEHVLAEFKKKDRSTCKKVYKGGMTCFQCIDKSGLKNEECMFVSESAPKRSHLAYQEVKEFTSKPPTLHASNEGAESITVTTSAPLLQKSAAYVVSPNGYGKKLKRKKTRPAHAPSGATFAAASPIVSAVPGSRLATNLPKVKRSAAAEPVASSAIIGESHLAPPEEFAGDSSKGAFWAETMPRYSAALGVTLPEFMLARSEHEALFDETVAGA